MNTQTELRCDPRSVLAARRFVGEALVAESVSADLRDTAALLVSELVTNAVLHAGSGVELSVACDRDWARVDVEDRGSHGVRRRRYRVDSTTGRGLILIDALASTWGVEPAGAGKRVWFEVREPVR